MSVEILVLEAVDAAVSFALKLAQLANLPVPGADKIEALVAKVNAQVARTLPAQLEAMAAGVAIAGAKIEADLATLPEVERCPNDGNVLTIHRASDGTRSTSCDRCGWSSS